VRWSSEFTVSPTGTWLAIRRGQDARTAFFRRDRRRALLRPTVPLSVWSWRSARETRSARLEEQFARFREGHVVIFLRAAHSWGTLDILDSGWDTLVERNPHATVFQTSGWYRAWVETAAAAEDAEPLVLRVPACGPPRTALALQRCRLEGEDVLRPLSWPWADYHDAVGDPSDQEAVSALVAGLKSLVNELGRTLVLDEIVPDGLLATALRPLSIGHPASVTETIDLRDSAHIARIVGRSEHRAKWRALQNRGETKVRHRQGLDEVLPLMPAFIDLHRKQWAARADSVAPFDGHFIDATFLAMVRQLAPAGRLVLTDLSLNDTPIAMYFGFVHANKYGGYRTTYDRDYRRLSPGHLMLQRMVVDFAAAGIRELDLMRGGYAYKRQYCNRTGRNRRFEFFPG
jgi:CelD/BcsL family acetyltransferase involved in cellulose biosynthesis